MSLPPKSDDEVSAPDEGTKPAKPRGRPRGRKPAAEAEPAREESKPEIFVPEKRPEPEAPPAPAPVAREAPQPAPANESRDTGGSRDVGGEPAAGGEERYGQGGGQGGQGGGQGGQGGGRGDWQDRNSWKRNKRKRGRHGGQWQPGPGGGQPR